MTAVVGVRRGETMGDLLDAVARRDAATALGLVAARAGAAEGHGGRRGDGAHHADLALAWGAGDARRAASPPGVLAARVLRALLKETGAFPGRPWGEAVTRVDGGHATAGPPPQLDRALDLLLEADVALKETRRLVGRGADR